MYGHVCFFLQNCSAVEKPVKSIKVQIRHDTSIEYTLRFDIVTGAWYLCLPITRLSNIQNIDLFILFVMKHHEAGVMSQVTMKCVL